ncbi:MAG: hypothetical protein K2W82_13850 [Candidatus Obscuribacterales bacterium]|nr:hypothetical protein [Candidatus Obscuribacterales bacterium]
MKVLVALSSAFMVFALPALAQSYHYSYGDSRVVNQNQTGLYTPSSTYIGGGTLSQSAQGKNAGTGNALPGVTMGGYIRTPGDTIYNGQGDGCVRMPNGSVIYKDDYQRVQMQQMMRYRRNQPRTQPVQQGSFYVPGSNGSASSYSATPAGNVGAYYQNGAAAYGSNYRSR